ncbi:MAG: sodium:proton antiporter, partial [Maribacter sp.]|nr:sodium:proton antiporter [Maribacter sp.]
MYIAIFLVFILGYIFIALEHSVKIDKAAIALLTGTLCWVLFIIGRDSLLPALTEGNSVDFISENLRDHLGDISEILFFLLGAMTI